MAPQPVPVAVNDLVELEVTDGPTKGRYRTRVENVHDDGRLLLAAPMKGGVRVFIPRDTSVVVHALKADRARGARYVGHASVIGRQEEGGVVMLVVAVPRWERVQLRSWARVTATVPVKYRPLRPPHERPACWISTESRDIGGGGLMLRTKHLLEPGQFLELAIELPQRPVQAVAEVVRVQAPDDREGEPETGYAAALKFVTIAEPDRDRIIRFVLRRQAEMRRMGLI